MLTEIMDRGRGYTVTEKSQSPELIEYVVKNRPQYPSMWQLACEGIFVAIKVTMTTLSVLSILAMAFLDRERSEKSIMFCIGLWIFTVLILLRRMYREETLMVIQDFGMQVSSSGMWYVGKRTRFIPKSKVLDILIQEAFIGFEIKFIMVIVVLGEPKLEVTFQEILPRRDDIEEIWRGVRRCYYKNEKR